MRAAFLVLLLAGCASAVPEPVKAPSGPPMIRVRPMCQGGALFGVYLIAERPGMWELPLDDIDDLAKVCESGI